MQLNKVHSKSRLIAIAFSFRHRAYCHEKDRQEPQAQGSAGFVQDSAGSDGYLVAAGRTLVEPAALDRIAFGSTAPRAGPVFRPAFLEEKARAVFLGGETLLKFQYRWGFELVSGI